MAEINVRGYVNAPKTRDGLKGPFSTFTLAERQKQKDGTYQKVYYDCVDFKNPTPEDSAFVTLSGWLNSKTYTKKDGTQGSGLSINVQKLEVAPPREGTVTAKAPGGDGDDFGF